MTVGSAAVLVSWLFALGCVISPGVNLKVTLLSIASATVTSIIVREVSR